MTVAGVAPLVVGALAVAQAGLNRQVAARHGLVVATCLNAAVFVACGAVLLGEVVAGPGRRLISHSHHCEENRGSAPS